MMRLLRMLALLVAPLLLASCLYQPGKFTSAMTVNADGRFSFSYKGEIAFPSLYQLSQMTKHDDVSAPDAEKCWGPPPGDAAADAPVVTGDREPKERECTKEERAERAEQRKAGEARQREEMARFQKLVGFDPSDENAMRAYAANIAKHKGWRSVAYRGNGIFDVDYAITGTLDRDFIFPLMPDAYLVPPMVVVRKRADGSVHITAPGYASIAGASSYLGLAATGLIGGMTPDKIPGVPLVDGVFTIDTDAPIMTNNTEDGATGSARKTLTWRVTQSSTKMPETLIKLNN